MRCVYPGVVLLLAALAPAASADMLDDYVDLATGTFSTAAQARQDQRYDAVTWHIAEIWKNRGSGDDRWLYSESWIDDADKPYMQRVSRLSVTDNGELLSERYRLPASADLVGAYADIARFDAIDEEDLDKLDGCDGVYVRAGTSRFEGTTIGRSCESRYKGASYAISQSVVTADGMTNWDRGFSEDGELVWGPAAGGYRFERAGADACNQPVRMLVYGDIHDRDKFLAYVRAIGDSGLYEATGGYYEGITPPLAVFEGDPPTSRGVVISRFPCLQAAKDFWYSDEYEAIRPLREGIAEFEVLVLPAPPLPGWLDE